MVTPQTEVFIAVEGTGWARISLTRLSEKLSA